MAKQLNFYDVKNRQSFNSSKYELKNRFVKGILKKYAVAKSPYAGKIEVWRVVSNDFKK